MTTERYAPGQTLLIDADDTLWENNIYFERAIAAYISFLDHRVHSPDEVRAHLNTVERATITAHGYGLRSFHRSLVSCFEYLTGIPPTDDERSRIRGFVESIADHEIELLPGVAETLADLARRHRILLVTKGDPEEQTGKLRRSCLAPHFTAVEVLPEKHDEAYRSLSSKHGCEAATTWMIGNSPKSDINPALAAGLHTIFIPHGLTWALEHEALAPVPPGQTLLQLPSFAALADRF